MRPPADYVVNRDVRIPGTYAYALRTGDEITEAGRQQRGLVVGVDVTPLRNDVMARPADGDPRSAWQDYAVVQGVPYAEAVDLDAAELRNRIETQADAPEPANAGEMPDASDRKAAWVDYAALQIVGATGGQVDVDTARDRAADRTKADLIEAFGPDAQDPQTDERFAPLWQMPKQVRQVGPHEDLIAEVTPEPVQDKG
jgi:hypothetical protein